MITDNLVAFYVPTKRVVLRETGNDNKKVRSLVQEQESKYHQLPSKQTGVKDVHRV